MLIVISGPSGVGKGTLITHLLQNTPELSLSVSATTRAPRAGEIHGKDYFFLGNDDFDNAIKNGDFIEWCAVHQHRYGTLRQQVAHKLNLSKGVVVEIDVQGAKKIKAAYDDNQFHIFIAPPSIEILTQRLQTRNTEPSSIIEKRIKEAEKELEEKESYDLVIVNNELTQTHIELNNVILSLLTEGVIE